MSLTRFFTVVSTFCVLLYELTQSKQINCQNTQRYRVLRCQCVCASPCLMCVLSLHTHVHTSRYVWEKSGSMIDVNTSPRLRLDPDGTLHISQTWSGDIGTYTCRVTSVGGNDSRSAHLRVRSVYLPHVCFVLSSCLYFFPSYLRLTGTWWMDVFSSVVVY